MNDANASICSIGWVKMSEMLYTKKVSVSRMILKCNSEDVKKARTGKSSFLISGVSKNLVMSVLFFFFFAKHVPWYFNCGRVFIDLLESTVI